MGEDIAYEWDEGKRRANLAKHGLDFADVSEFDWEFATIVGDLDSSIGEHRLNAVAPLGEKLAFLTFTVRDERVRVISLRPANRSEVRRWKDEYYD